VIAGYGIAVPVGPIAILVIDTALRGGFRPGLMAAAGAASADFIYAGLAAVAGEVIAAALAPFMLALRIASAVVLLALGGYGLWRTRAVEIREGDGSAQIRGGVRTYAQFLGLTLLNPLTVTYFGALILGGRVETLGTTPGRTLFVTGAWLASLSWQIFLATVGALARRRLSPRFQVLTSVVGNLIVIGLGLRVLAEVAG
jgi:threonine/homoserine/homoserine lactone efflux protein